MCFGVEVGLFRVGRYLVYEYCNVFVLFSVMVGYGDLDGGCFSVVLISFVCFGRVGLVTCISGSEMVCFIDFGVAGHSCDV